MEVQFSKIQPWVEKWIEVQVPAIVHREIFAKDRTILEVKFFFFFFNLDILNKLIFLKNKKDYFARK